MVHNGSLPEDPPSACSAAVMADIACDCLVPDLRPDFFYPLTSLDRIWAAGCTSVLEAWETSVRSACGKDTIIPANHDLSASSIVIPATRRHIYSLTCLKENSVFCEPVAALAYFFSNSGSEILSLHYLPTSQTKVEG